MISSPKNQSTTRVMLFERGSNLFENVFKQIDDVLRKDAGCSSELDYIEQTSWILFLKYLDDLDRARKLAKDLAGEMYSPLLEQKYRWESWACPKDKNGKIDFNSALTGDDLREFVNNELFSYLSKFKFSSNSFDTLEYKIGEIFSEITNKVQSGYNLREILELVDTLKFQTSADKHEMSHLYEDKIKNMGNAGRNGGEYYTPRPLIKAMIKVVDPKIGETIYDGAVGSAGFLCESFLYLMQSKKLTPADIEVLQKKTFFGKEKKSLAYIIGTMNMILHGIDAPNIIHTNSLSENTSEIQEKDRYDIVLANPPFGGKERSELQQNFVIKTSETAYLFLQHFMKSLRAGGKAGIVIKNTFLSNTDNASIQLRKDLLETCNLHTILDCPSGTFVGAGVKTVVLFFKKGEPTKNIWYYQLDPGRKMGKLNPLNDGDLEEFLEFQKRSEVSKLSWIIERKDIDPETWDLSVRNLNRRINQDSRMPAEIISEIEALEESNMRSFSRLRTLL